MPREFTPKEAKELIAQYKKQRDRVAYANIPLSDEEVQNLNKGIAYNAIQMIFSKYSFTEDDIRLIEQARAEKAQDENNEN